MNPALAERASTGGDLGETGEVASEGACSGGAEEAQGTAAPDTPAPPPTEGVVRATTDEGQVDIKVHIPLTSEDVAHLAAIAVFPGLAGATWTGSPPRSRRG